MENKFNLTTAIRLSIGVTLGAVLLSGVFSSPVRAYNPEVTHFELAERSAQLFNRDNAHRQLTEQEQLWISEGARDEDVPATRVINHFFDPIHNEGLSGFSSSKEWSHDGSAQKLNRFGARDMTWERALEAYEEGDSELAYRILGHLLHLIQDATVPAHVRQDPHLHAAFGPIILEGYGGKDPYERATELFSSPRIEQMHIPNYGTFNAYLESAAEYTNRNFLSMDSAGSYTHPAVYEIKEGFIYGQIDSTTYRLAALDLIETRFEYENFSDLTLDSTNFSDPLVVADYWSRLAPTAVEHGAGVIELFHNSVKEPSSIEEQNVFARLFEDITGAVSHISSSTKSTWDLIEFAWNRHAINVASISFALQTNNTPSASVETYQAQRDEAARQAFFQQLLAVANREQIDQQTVLPAQTSAEDSSGTGGPVGGETVFVSAVIDGDTIELSDGRRVRYIGIDAPELGTGCYADASAGRNAELVLNKEVVMVEGERDTDDYGRLLRFIWIGSTFVNQSLIETGHAYAFDFGQPHEYSELFSQRQQVARENQIGLWGPLCQEELPLQETEEELEEPKIEEIPPAEVAPLLINEVRMQENEFIELKNPTNEDISLAGYYIVYYASTRQNWDEPSWRKNIPIDATIEAGEFYTISFGPDDLPDGVSDWHPYQSNRLAQTIGSVAIFANDPQTGGQRIDAFGWGDVALAEGVPFNELPDDNGSAAREGDSDSDDNMNDFYSTTTATPGSSNIIIKPAVDEEEETQEEQDDSGGNGGAGDNETDGVQEDPPQPIEGILITEIQVSGETARDEFIELYNQTEEAIDMTGWKLRRKTSSGENESALVSEAVFSGTIPTKHHFLIIPETEEGEENPYTGQTQHDLSYSSASYSITDDNTLLLYDPNDFLIDKVGYGAATDFEGSAAAPNPAPNESISRIIVDNTYQDTDDNAKDFEISEEATPQNTTHEVTLEENPWETSLTSSNIRHPHTDSNSNIYFSEGESVSSYAPDGTQRWQNEDVLAYEGAALSADGSVLYTTGCRAVKEPEGCFFAALNTNNGNIFEITQIDSHANNGGPTKPVLDEAGNVYVATTGSLPGSIWKFNPDGTPVDEETSHWPISWEAVDWEEIEITPARNYINRIQPLSISGDSLVIAAELIRNAHYLFAFDLTTGELLWQKDAEQESITHTRGVTKADEDSIYTTYRTFTQAGVAAYSTDDGTLRWNESFGNDNSSLLSLGGNEDFLFSLKSPSNDILYRFSRETGQMAEIFETTGSAAFTTALAFDDENVYVADEEGVVRAFRMEDSQMVWEYVVADSLQHVVPTSSIIYGITKSGELITLGHWIE